MEELILKNPRLADPARREGFVASAGAPKLTTRSEIETAAECARLEERMRSMQDRFAFLAADIVWFVCIIGVSCSFMFELSSASVARGAAAISLCLIMMIVPRLIRKVKFERALSELCKKSSKRNLPFLVEQLPRLRGSQRARTIATLNLHISALQPGERCFARADFERIAELLKLRDVALAGSLLHAVEVAGAIETLPVVIRIAKGGLIGRRSESVRQTAILCMESLEARLTDKRNLARILALYKVRLVHPRLAGEIRRALLELLPLLTPADRQLFNAPARRTLYSLIETRDAQLILAILEMLPVVGLTDSLAYVSALATGKTAENRDFTLVRNAATMCSRKLAGLLKTDEYSSTLVRASGLNVDTPDLLVRPAVHTEVDADTLMRAGLADAG